MTNTISVTNVGATFPASRGTILDAALDAGVPFPHGCRAGNCGNCKSRLLTGEVDMDNLDPGVLSPEEQAERLILVCRAKPRTDILLEWLCEPDNVIFPVRKHRATVAEVSSLTPDITRVRLELRGGRMAFAAGQYAEVMFGRLPPRPYSMANRPDESMLEFHIRHMPNGLVSGYVADTLKPGQVAKLKGPYGSAYLRKDGCHPMLAIAGGSGLAPIKSIVETALANGFEQGLHLYVGARDEPYLYYKERFLELASAHSNFRFLPVLSAPSGSTDRRTGWVHDAVAADLSSLATWKIYLAGPPPMVDVAKAMAIDRGARPENICADAFYPATNRQWVRPNLLGGMLRARRG